MKLSIMQKVYLGFGLVLTLLVAVAVTAVRSERAFVASNASERHAFQVIDEVRGIEALVVSAESSRRAYLLASETRLLKPYEDAVSQWPSRFQNLRQLTTDNPDQHKRLDLLRPIVDRKFELLRYSIVLHQHGKDENSQAALTLEGVPLTETIREMTSAMVKDERTLLAERSTQTAVHANATEIFLILSAVMGIVTVLLAGMMVRRDINERMHAETEMRLQSAALESAANAIVITDEKGTIVWVNPAFTRTTGYSSEEAVGENPRLLKSDKQDNTFYQEMWKTILDGRVWHGTIINRRKDGNLNQEDMTITPICNPAGQITHFVSIKQDITEKTRAAAALLTSELRYRRLFESAKDGILILDAVSGQIIDVNPFLIEMLHFSKDELTGKTLWEIGVFKDVVASKSAFVELQDHGFVRYENLPLESRHGQVKQVEFVSNSYQVNGSRVIQCNIRDITERKQAEDALAESENRLRAILEAEPECVKLLAEDGSLIDMNPAGLAMIEAESLSEVKGKNVCLMALPEHRHAFMEVNRRVFAGESATLEFEISGIKGTQRWLEMHTTPLRNKNHEIIAALGVTRDVTERRKAEEELLTANQGLARAFSELQDKNDELASMTQHLWQASKLATMGELAASIAHELNNPLATVGLRTETLLMQLPEDSVMRKPLEIISQEIDRMATLVSNLLQFSRRGHRQVSTVDPREEVANSVEFIHYHLGGHNVEVIRDFADPLPTIQADRQQLRQLFLNLLTNASDAMPKGGTLTVRAATGKLNDAEAVVIEFVDSGEGITQENLEKLWEPFFTTKPEGKGTGLGLAICRRIVEEHGGTINIQSEAHLGTTVRMVFPATIHGVLS